MRMLVLLLLPLVAAADTGQTLFQNVCAQCHGAKGEGNVLMKAPAIAHVDAWYVEAQLMNFRNGHRGTDKTDAFAQIMAATAKAIPAESIKSIAKYVAQMAPTEVEPSDLLKGANVTAGRELFEERCMECHRYNASGEIVFGSPPLTAQHDWYLLEQIRRFKDGRRGAIPGDANGAKMVFSSQFITDDQVARDVVAYIMSLNVVPDTELFGQPTPPKTPQAP